VTLENTDHPFFWVCLSFDVSLGLPTLT